ncbi:hypothetical protein [Tritonibacter mobilis]|uniref:hypothetical protein n=1 Tax=Tritonibacter mobilis TaxID=379347 RepID=UPI001401DC76|nr:hypothetical protein [Tritonibacter mobilis]NHM19507.1 hypothetical protein [Tritonibacter mobilis]NHM23657.1 hypothetical protein [Tritonibacter mobilis]
MIKIYDGDFEHWFASVEEAREARIGEDKLGPVVREQRKAAISAECRRRIYAAASAEAQMNMATSAAIISGKAEADRSEDEVTVLDGVRLALDWVVSMRAAFESMSKDPDADYLADAAWPVLPPEIPPIIDRF